MSDVNMSRVKLKHSFFSVISGMIIKMTVAAADPLEQCVPHSNLPNQVTEIAWTQNATIQNLMLHRDLLWKLKANKFFTVRDRNFVITGHELVRSTNDILTFKQIFPGWPNLTDTSIVTHISVALPKKLIGNGKIHIGGKAGAVVFVSTGSPAFRNYCYGYGTDGEITYTAKAETDNPLDAAFIDSVLSTIGEEGVLVGIKFHALLIRTRRPNDGCGRCIFEGKFLAKKNRFLPGNRVRCAEFRRRTAWVGRACTHARRNCYLGSEGRTEAIPEHRRPIQPRNVGHGIHARPTTAAPARKDGRWQYPNAAVLFDPEMSGMEYMPDLPRLDLTTQTA